MRRLEGPVDKADDPLLVVTGGPDVAEEISRVKGVIPEELAIASTAIHEVRIKFTPELGAGFGQDPWQIGNIPEGVSEGWEIIPGDFYLAECPALDRLKVVTTDGSNEKGSAWSRGLLIDIVLHKVEEFAGLIANFPQKPEIGF